MNITKKRLDYIKDVEFPEGVMQRVALAYPILNPQELFQVEEAFREYAGACVIEGPNSGVAMPSKSVDEVWHQLMLHTRFYQEFCEKAFGEFLHHEPGPLSTLKFKKQESAPCVNIEVEEWDENVEGVQGGENMNSIKNHTSLLARAASDVELAKAWRGALSARDYWGMENVSIPLLFEADAKLAIPQGIYYSLLDKKSVVSIHHIRKVIQTLPSPNTHDIGEKSVDF